MRTLEVRDRVQRLERRARVRLRGLVELGVIGGDTPSDGTDQAAGNDGAPAAQPLETSAAAQGGWQIRCAGVGELSQGGQRPRGETAEHLRTEDAERDGVVARYIPVPSQLGSLLGAEDCAVAA